MSIDHYGKDLSGFDFRDQSLRGADLVKTDLDKSDFRGADLEGANFLRADAVAADFRGARLRGADMRYTCLALSRFEGADMRGVDLDGCSFDETTFDSETLLAGAKVSGVVAYPMVVDGEPLGAEAALAWLRARAAETAT